MVSVASDISKLYGLTRHTGTAAIKGHPSQNDEYR